MNWTSILIAFMVCITICFCVMEIVEVIEKYIHEETMLEFLYVNNIKKDEEENE